MKRILLLMILSCFTVAGFAQGTYYWVSGSTNATSLTGANWSVTPGGTAGTRSNAADVLIFDGVTVTFTIGSGTVVGKLQLQNGADVSFNRNSATGSSTFTVDNGSNNALEIKGNSKLRVIDGTGGNFIFALAANSTATVDNSEVYIQGAAWSANTLGGQRIQVPTAGAFVFSNGSKCFVNVINQYPFSSISGSAAKAFVFNSGTSLIYQGGRSPFGDTSTGYVADMKLGSDYVLEANNSVNGLFNGKSFGNVIVRNNAVISLNENFSSIHNLTVQSGSFLLRASGVSPFTGNIVNNGTFGVAPTVTTSQLLMIGTVAQSISGSGTFTDFGAISVGADANVTLSHSLNLMGSSTSSVSGALDFSTYNLTGTGDFAFRQKYSITNSAATVNANSAVITLPAVDYPNAGVALGVLVEGPQIPANSYIVATNGTAFQFTISNPATANGNSVTLVTKPKMTTANSNGIDGSVQTVSGRTFGADVNYVFNATTTTPFTISGNALGEVTFNAPATTNRSVTINGKLTLNNAKLTLREADVITIGAGGSFDGAFGSSSYIATAASTTTGAVGTLRVTGLAASTVIPVGTASNYLPVTLNPTTASNFDINVFAGTTTDATPNGTALTAAQKLKMVDATWNIQRTSGNGNAEVTLGWDGALEGTDFANFTDAQIGVATYNGGTYAAITSSGNAAANTATFTTSSFSPFVVGEANATLPLTLISFTPKESLNSVKLEWKTTNEVNLKNYVLQHKVGNDFKDIYTVSANNKPGFFTYNYTDLNPMAGVNYYRLVGVDLDGTTHVSEPKSINVTLANAVAVYPNPMIKSVVSVSGIINGDIIKILNIQGQVIATQKATGNQVQEINVQNIQAGTYILSVENAGKITAMKKLIKI